MEIHWCVSYASVRLSDRNRCASEANKVLQIWSIKCEFHPIRFQKREWLCDKGAILHVCRERARSSIGESDRVRMRGRGC